MEFNTTWRISTTDERLSASEWLCNVESVSQSVS